VDVDRLIALNGLAKFLFRISTAHLEIEPQPSEIE